MKFSARYTNALYLYDFKPRPSNISTYRSYRFLDKITLRRNIVVLHLCSSFTTCILRSSHLAWRWCKYHVSKSLSLNHDRVPMFTQLISLLCKWLACLSGRCILVSEFYCFLYVNIYHLSFNYFKNDQQISYSWWVGLFDYQRPSCASRSFHANNFAILQVYFARYVKLYLWGPHCF